ncbi:anaerobic ribonucleoside-triphosphate reductase activating protein [Lutispora saccharofermentans]|uniref:Anaerobic ribonucleoside-triphosphate reductase-activating protein n=1 Tax=Lutispora saccharofermentans TaxID=3024236 RepID=A0ABT1NA33_9FIRM|nr:anaerobic ribonucleoside-triphosphate reductase activating protein [Lutispora saccharofermentans]MCQ1528115.1 anaerobic ribonucleoside-triphosphate reductase activating protein [Lutispora saccharofermentans]
MFIKVAGLEKESIVDGKGIRYVIFAQGCPHKCKGCHNPITHSFDGGSIYEVDELVKDIQSNAYIDGITCSGGECFEQAEAFAFIAEKTKAMGKDVWAYSGYEYDYIISHKEEKPFWKELLGNVDVLVDGPYIEEKKDLSLCFRGSSNQRIIDIKESLTEGKIVLMNL